MSLGENIYKLRTEKNMSQGHLADALEVSRQSVSKWENNSAVPELEKLIKMAELFDITLDELVGNTQAETAATPQETTQYPPVEIQRPAVPIMPVVGIALLCCAILSLILFILFDMGEFIFYVSIPLIIVSIPCISTNKKFRRNYWISMVVIILALFALCVTFNSAVRHETTEELDHYEETIIPD